MKKILMIMLVIMFSAVFLGGCNGTSSSTTPLSSSSLVIPSSSLIPITSPDMSPADVSASPDEGQDDEAKAITYNGWIYYLDVNDPVVVDYNEDPPMHMKKIDGSSDQQLGIRGFEFDIIGNYIYVDSNDPDLDENGTQTWSTTRMNLDGSDKKKLEYGSMSARLIPQGEQEFYFTTMGDGAIYISDFSCENVTTLIIDLPDKSELDKKLGTDKVLQLGINEITNGSINFDVTFSTEDGIELFSGSYKITADGKTIEKSKGTYFSYGSQENE